jgi:hypothetical protein
MKEFSINFKKNKQMDKGGKWKEIDLKIRRLYY